MHTLDELEAADFRYVSDGRSVGKDEVMPSISIADRLGVVMGNGTEGLGAGTFVLASVIDFYDTLRERKADFFEYPDFYTFQATTEPADYRMFDIYPDHKNVVTDADAEAILRAVNDRAIDHLLVPESSRDRGRDPPERRATHRVLFPLLSRGPTRWRWVRHRGSATADCGLVRNDGRIGWRAFWR